jgi:leucyl aminopeptidase
MPIRLPLSSLLVPARFTALRPSASTLARYAGALVLLPLKPTSACWSALPDGERLRSLYARRVRKEGDHCEVRVGPRAGTALVLVALPAGASAFERLQLGGKLAKGLLESEPRSLLLWHEGCAPGPAAAALEALVAALEAGAFRLASFKSKRGERRPLERIDIAALGASRFDLEATLATAAGNNLARWLTALPPNVLDARGYRRLLEELARRLGLRYRFYGEGPLRRLGAGAFLAVSQGNAARDAGIAHLSYRPRGARRAPLALVGKGICFDTGGTNLKPHKGMLDMHTDMEGSAVAVGSLYALKQLIPAQPIDCWLAITENRIGPLSYQPQDVVRALNGTTIQVVHTDAEGRMVLADTLALAARARPAALIDYATLTGSCVYALTERYSGAFTNRPETRAQIEAAGAASGERVWCFPMDKDFDTDLDSTVADILQCSVESKGDHILAARFLSRFVPPSLPWLHLDLAAGTRTGGLGHIATEITGFGVRYTAELARGGWPLGSQRERKTLRARRRA